MLTIPSSDLLDAPLLIIRCADSDHAVEIDAAG